MVRSYIFPFLVASYCFILYFSVYLRCWNQTWWFQRGECRFLTNMFVTNSKIWFHKHPFDCHLFLYKYVTSLNFLKFKVLINLHLKWRGFMGPVATLHRSIFEICVISYFLVSVLCCELSHVGILYFGWFHIFFLNTSWFNIESKLFWSGNSYILPWFHCF